MTQIVEVPLSDKQLGMVNNPAEVLWVGAGTKTGKTIGFGAWIAQGLLEGEPTAWCGPWSPRTKLGYDTVKGILKYGQRIDEVKCNDSTMRITSKAGGSFEPHTGDNAQAIYGGAYKRFVIDEASRQKVDTFDAAQTTIASIQGKIKIAFNLDHGSKNWAIRNLLRVKAMSLEERAQSQEDYMLFPTMLGGFVTQEQIDRQRGRMTPAKFNALYYAVIPESDVALFRNLPEIFVGKEVEPKKVHSYVQGIDLARKHDWTVGIVYDTETNAVVDMVRFNEISWNLQYEKLANQYRQWGCTLAHVDESSIGDPVLEELIKRDMNCEGVVFTAANRTALLEALVIACDSKAFTVPSTERFHPLREELDLFEYVMEDRGKVRYEAPEHMHDDTVMAMALALQAAQSGNYGLPNIHRGSPRLAPINFASF